MGLVDCFCEFVADTVDVLEVGGSFAVLIWEAVAVRAAVIVGRADKDVFGWDVGVENRKAIQNSVRLV